MTEGIPKPPTVLEFMQSRLPIKVKQYLELDQTCSNPSLPDHVRERAGTGAMKALGDFSRMDYRSLMDYVVFKREYLKKIEPRLKL